MKLNLLHLLLFVLLLSFPAADFSQTLAEKIKEIDDYAVKVQKDWNTPGFAVGIVKDDKIVFAKGYGVRELGKPEKVDENTLFAIASNSKSFTTASLAILVDEGKIKWDDRVIKYLPEFQLADSYTTREMTIRDLVSHRSGFDTFSGDLLWYETNYTNDEIIGRLRYLKPKTSFRSSYGYQNLMFITAGKIVERVSGKTWQQFVTERILQPLGMTRTTTSVKDLKDNYASPHNESGGNGLRVLPSGNVDGAAGAVRINSSVAEMCKWLRLQLDHGTIDGRQIFSAARSWEMQQPNISIPISQRSAESIPSRHFNSYGMGWFLSDYQGRKLVNHSGGLDGMLSYTAMMPEENLGLVVITNSESSIYQIMMYKILDVFTNAPKRDWNAETLQRYNDGKALEKETEAKIEAAHVKNTKPGLEIPNYAGTYASDLYGDVKIETENGKLVMRMIPSPNLVADLEFWQYDTFRIHWRPSVSYNFPTGFVTFTLDKNGQTDQLKIDQPNDDFWFYELELKRVKSRS